MTRRILVHAINGKGLGHLNRTLVLARAMRAAEPELSVHFVVDSPFFELVSASGFEVVKLPDRYHPLGFHHGRARRAALLPELFDALLEAWKPEALLVDFLCRKGLFECVHRHGARVGVVLRKQKPAALRRLAWSGGASEVDSWLIPHSEEELPPGELPRGIRRRAVHLGPVVRSLNPSRCPAVRARYAPPDETLVVATVGGGGFPESAATLDAVQEAVQAMAPAPRLLVLLGPNFGGSIPADSGEVLFRRFEPELPELMAAADAVVCNAGYNTLRELKQSGTPAVIVPLKGTGRDDQEERAKGLVEDGCAVLSDASAESIRSGLRAILEQGKPARRDPARPPDATQLGRQVLAALRGNGA